MLKTHPGGVIGKVVINRGERYLVLGVGIEVARKRMVLSPREVSFTVETVKMGSPDLAKRMRNRGVVAALRGGCAFLEFVQTGDDDFHGRPLSIGRWFHERGRKKTIPPVSG